VAQSDRAIPSRREGKDRPRLGPDRLKGNVKKVSTVQCNDPSTHQVKLTRQGKVSTFIDILPDKAVLFQGHAASMAPKTVEIIGKNAPFRVTDVISDLEGRVAHELILVNDFIEGEISVKPRTLRQTLQQPTARSTGSSRAMRNRPSYSPVISQNVFRVRSTYSRQRSQRSNREKRRSTACFSLG
jgi:hypothetical protein